MRFVVKNVSAIWAEGKSIDSENAIFVSEINYGHIFMRRIYIYIYIYIYTANNKHSLSFYVYKILSCRCFRVFQILKSEQQFEHPVPHELDQTVVSHFYLFK